MPYGSNFPSLNFRTTGSWGPGNGLDSDGRLTNVQVDENFDELGLAIEDLRDNPPTADSVSNVTSTASSFTIHLSSGTTFGPFTLPVASLSFQGEWTAATSYQTNDIVKVTGDGVYLVLQDHTSAGTFDSAAADSDGPIYHFMIGAGADGADGTNGTNGTNGTDGATWYTGIGAPSISDAVQGDLYLDTGDSDGTGEGDVYEHLGSDGFVLIASLKGTTGDTGAQGPTGAGSNIIVEEGTVALASPVSNLNFDGTDFNVVQESDGTANVSIASGGGWTFQETVTTTGGTTLNINVAGKKSVQLVIRSLSQSSSGRPILHLSPDDGTTVRNGASDYFLLFFSDAATSAANQVGVHLGSGNTTGEQQGIVEIHGLDTAQRQSIRSMLCTAAAGVIRRDGWSNTAEAIQTVVIEANAGTFDAVAIDVWVQ